MDRVVILFALFLFSSLLRADEVDRLLEEVRPPSRFANHVPNFSATREQFTFESDTGQIKRSVWVIKDGDRYVALWHQQGSKLYVVAPTPARARKKIEMPPTYNSGGNTFDGKLPQQLQRRRYHSRSLLYCCLCRRNKLNALTADEPLLLRE